MRNYLGLFYSLLSDRVNRYYLVHGRNSNLIDNEKRMWKCFTWLKHEYGPFLDSLPLQELPVSSCAPPIIWWCWLQGEENAPELCRASLASLRKHLSDYIIRVVSEENLDQFVTIPDIIREKYASGIIPNAQYSDIVRTLLLVQHGGTWIDSTVFCTGYNVPILETPFFVYQNWKFGAHQASVCSNWLISAAPSHPILEAVLALLLKYWKENESLLDYFLYHLFFHMATEKYPALWDAVPRFSNIPPHIMQFEMFKPYDSIRYKHLCMMSDFHKLNWKAQELEKVSPDSLYAYIMHKT